jgi:hypothetical protein
MSIYPPPQAVVPAHSPAWAIWTNGKPLTMRVNETTARSRTTFCLMDVNILSLPRCLLEGSLSVAPSEFRVS